MNLKINITLFVIIIFIFLNDLGLPFGLQFTTLLAPLLFLKFSIKYWKFFALYLSFSLFFLVIQFFNYEVGWFYYGRSYILHFLVFVQTIAFYHVVNNKPGLLKEAFEKVVVLNSILTIVAVALLVTGISSYMWEISKVSNSIGVMPRLRMFTVEPSYYSMMLAPFIFYYLSEIVNNRKQIDIVRLCFLGISLIISFSFGVIAGIFISILIVYFIKIKNLVNKKVIYTFFILCFSLVLFYYIKPDNLIFVRLEGILSGNDSSGNGRIVEPWILTFQMLKENDAWFFGIGWGQIRTLGQDIIKNYYQYTHVPEHKFGLPNILTEITTMFGLFGLFCVLSIQMLLFFVTKVSKSTYRSLIFWFILIYQFTGSYSTSVLYYCFWVLAFSPKFDLLNVKKKSVEN